jgi:hypothetical protein
MQLPPEWAQDVPVKGKGRYLIPDEVAQRTFWEKHLLAVGFGRRSWIERAESTGEAIGYITKVAGHHEQSVRRMGKRVARTTGEIVKLTQLPMNAPSRFRRLRAGKGFLPPRRKNPAVTGTLLRRTFDRHDGTPMVMPLHEIKDAEVRAISAEACYHEHDLWEAERESARTLVGIVTEAMSWRGPVTTWSRRIERIGINAIEKGSTLSVVGARTVRKGRQLGLFKPTLHVDTNGAEIPR